MNKNNFEDTDYIEDINPEELYKNVEKIRVGDILEGKIIQITREGVYVDIGSKADGFIDAMELNSYKDISQLFKSGETVRVMITKLDFNNVHLVSYRKAKQKELFNSLDEAYKSKKVLEAKVLTLTDFGAVVDIGIDVKLPFREMTKEFKSLIKSNQNITVPVIIKEIKTISPNEMDIIVSQKDVVEMEREQKKNRLFNSVKEGDIVLGEVKNIVDFGAFVDIGGVDALLHIGDIAWHKVDKPADILHVGDKIKVKVLKIDTQSGKVSVGLKQLFPHPWESVENKYKKGEVVKGKIVNITAFGIFVELEQGVEGLVHISEVDWKNPKEVLNKKYKIGDIIEAKVLEVNKEEKRISLSIKKTAHNPWEDLKRKYPTGTKIKGKVVKVIPSGIFVNIENSFDGFIRITDISWTRDIRSIKEIAKVGDDIECVVREILPDEEKAVLSIKHLKENPYDKYKKGTIVNCRIKKVAKTYMIVELEKDVEGIIRIKEAFQDEKSIGKTVDQVYKPGQQVDAVVIVCDEKERKIELSIKLLEKETRKQLIRKFSEVKTPTLGDILEEK